MSTISSKEKIVYGTHVEIALPPTTSGQYSDAQMAIQYPKIAPARPPMSV